MQSSANCFIHPNALVETKFVGKETKIWAFVHILDGARIGNNCNICDHCFIESKVVIGNRVTVKSGIYLWDGITIKDDVHLGPNVVFTNDLRPRSKQPFIISPILIKKSASVGANSSLLGGITIGEYAMIGMGSVVTKSVPDYALVYGNPARKYGWVDKQGFKMIKGKNNQWLSHTGEIYIEKGEKLIVLK